MKQEGVDNMGLIPCVFTEIGIPYDMDDKYAYKNGDYISQIRALDANHYALEGAQVGFTLWTYCVEVSHTWPCFTFYKTTTNCVSRTPMNGVTNGMVKTSVYSLWMIVLQIVLQRQTTLLR